VELSFTIKATKQPLETSSCSGGGGAKAYDANDGQPLELRPAAEQELQILAAVLAWKLPFREVTACYQAFRALDTEHSGMVSRESFRKAAAKGGMETFNADLTFNSADLDNDGFLEFHEFVAIAKDWEAMDQDVLRRHINEVLEDHGTAPVKLSQLFYGRETPKKGNSSGWRLICGEDKSNDHLTVERFLTLLQHQRRSTIPPLVL